ncbi:MAG TPA: serine/threonine-protein kinase [Polyangiales bacterium]|nr:serine/threonine-protein kinase [Polyangiales bacterium]
MDDLTPLARAPVFQPKLHVGSHLAHGRLRIEQVLGQGGMGTVYQAYDNVRRGHVALKTMHRVDPNGIYALKNEFRSLLGIDHPNLVRLFELYGEDDGWFFTMQLVRGLRLDTWVRPRGTLNARRLRIALAQLVDAIATLHAHGKLHRDIKPSNTLVSERGHVVVLDFGLITDSFAYAAGQTLTDQLLVGTPAYVAPEQVHGGRPTRATDAYALGVLLFEALTGRLPFDGTGHAILLAKQEAEPHWPPEARRSLPLDLVLLCDQLLSREPDRRPDILTLRDELVHRPNGRHPLSTSPIAQPSELIGRDHEFAEMRAAYAATLAGQPAVVAISGESGMGKTSVCEQFLAELDRQDGALVLRGRCNERESVAFKAFDAMVDSVSRKLRRMSPTRAGRKKHSNKAASGPRPR